MRYPSLTVTAVLCAHLGVPSSLDATSTGHGAPAKIGVVDAAAAFVVPSSNRHRTHLPTHSKSMARSTAFGTNRQQELSHILSPASRKQTLTHLPSSIIDAPQTLSTSHDDDDDDTDGEASSSSDAKLEADAEAFFEQMMARRSSIMEGADTNEAISEGTAPDVPDSTTLRTNTLNADGPKDHLKGKSDDEIAEEWHNDQMANALASVQSMNGRAALEHALESIELEEQKIDEAAHVDNSVGHDQYVFQQSRLERQLIQPKTTYGAFEDVPAEPVADRTNKSANTAYAFQEARLQRQLAQPRPLPPSLEQGSRHLPSSDESTSNVPKTSKVNAKNIAFQRVRLARQLAQPRPIALESSPTLNDQRLDEELSEIPKPELSEEEIQARRAYYKRIEALSEEVLQKAWSAVDRVLQEQRRQETGTLDTTEEVLSFSSQSEYVGTSVMPKDRSGGDNDAHTTMPLQIPNAQSILATVLPERSLTELSDEAEIDIARYAAIHFTRAAFDTTRASVFTLGAFFEAIRDPKINPESSKTNDRNSALASVTSASNSALSFLGAIGRSDASKLAVEAVSSAAHQYSSFLAACGALGLRAGANAKVHAEDYKQQVAEAQRRKEEAKAEEKRQMLAKIAEIAKEKRLEEERISAERRRLEMVRQQEEDRIAAEKKALAKLKARIELEKKRVEEERIVAEMRAIKGIRRKAEEKQRSLDMELEKNGLVEKKTVEITNSRQEETVASSKSQPLFFAEQEKETPFFFVDEQI